MLEAHLIQKNCAWGALFFKESTWGHIKLRLRRIEFVRNAPEENLIVPGVHLIQKNCAWGASNCVWGVLILKESTLGRVKLRLRRIEFVRNVFEELLIVTKVHLI